ncbi:glyoxylase-like metal-dependent hydrolase (beta-lactamase superfamily II) [Mycetocola sp. BIGb0189]|uniref:MBL fold metallo-hydrolase n=1 Tax=Mycetocola sp. BIGb0189 TaxID=2940604 RepID=UPI002168F675|nr:MBL fold metallo-hydrolase [Mycetocola sp. BIGb0189]MCS4275958.1 glyoxylase-like metal-dependent hydrolase (beta-lactamase superfamily II) [Mycetocola sp. BIGb0189]
MPLSYAVLTTTRQGVTRNLPHGPEDLLWVANAATLILGEKHAILVDTFTTIEQNEELIAWVRSFQRELTHVFITHGHGDHFFGIGQLLEAFPTARAVASPGSVAGARVQGSPASIENFWGRLFPGQIPAVVLPEALESGRLTLEGHNLDVIETGFTDTPDSTVLWVPDLGLIVGGDAVYNDTHQYTAETTTETREQWARAAEKLARLNPTAVVAAHKRPDALDSPDILLETARYLRDFNEVEAATGNAEELYTRMLERYPRRANPGALWGGAQVAKPSQP